MVTIKEAELLTGITRQNIRYYEKMGLIYPNREKENQYRKYNKEDISRSICFENWICHWKRSSRF